MYYFNQFPPPGGEQPATQQYVVHNDFSSAPFQLDSSSGELTVYRSLQMEGTLSKYDIVVEADHNQPGEDQVRAWTVTTIDIGETVVVLVCMHRPQHLLNFL